jgi:outer membrane protein assembly factor BamB
VAKDLFYEVTVSGKKMSIRYGRIGDPGQTQTKSFATPAAAKAEADKKIKGKLKDGYENAVMGVRQKRPVARRTVNSQPSTARPAPVLWKFNSGNTALGIFVDDQLCWVGNEAGKVFALDHQGKVERQYQLPDGVKALVGDVVWMYAGCDDGNVYDLTGPVPRLAYEIEQDDAIDWLDIADGVLAVSTMGGEVEAIDPESQVIWHKHERSGGGYAIRCDGKAVYHGHGNGATAYDLRKGKELWRGKTPGVLFSWQTAKQFYVGTIADTVVGFDKKKGTKLATLKCDDPVLAQASTSDDGYVFAADMSSSVYCFDARGKRLWKLGTGCGSALSMQFHNDRVYVVTSDGYLACLDASEAAVKAAEAGQVPKAAEIKAPAAGKAATPSNKLGTTSDAKKGVLVECVQVGGRPRIRVVSPGYHKDWFVQFPRDAREVGARYVVDEVHETSQGGFYRAYGEINKLVPVAGGRKRS